MERLTKNEMQELVGVKITDREYLFLANYKPQENEKLITKLELLANYRYLRLQEKEKKILLVYDLLVKAVEMLDLNKEKHD